MAIYLDTSVLPREGDLHAPQIAALEGVARAVGQPLVLPAMVLVESVSARRREVEQAFDAILTALRQAERLAKMGGLYLPDPSEIAAEWEAELRRTFEIAPLPPQAGEEALLREANRVRPARDGYGARDAAIWLTVLSDHRQRGSEGYFVSANTKDFADPSARSLLHPDLQAELAGTAPLRYAAGLDALLDAIATKTKVEITGAGILEQMEVTAAITRAVEDVLPRFVLADAPAGHPPIYLTRPPDFAEPDVRRVEGYEVAGGVYAFVLMRCQANVRAGLLERYGLGGTERPVDLVLAIRLRLWLELEVGGRQVLSADASLMAPPDVSAASEPVSLGTGWPAADADGRRRVSSPLIS